MDGERLTARIFTSLHQETIGGEAQYRAALHFAREFLEKEPCAGTPEALQFDRVCEAIEAYEKENYPLPEAIA